MTKSKLKIDIVSDINCPWCYLGEARLQNALTQTSDKFAAEVTFKPFELNPNATPEGEDKQEYFIRHYGSEALPRLNASSEQLTEAGKAEGVVFDFYKADKVHNTFNGHRLIWLAGQYGVQVAVAKALFEANFTHGKNMNDPAVLSQIGQEQGIPAERLENFFASEEGKNEVKSMEKWAQQVGISGVPAFIINDQYLISGAQPAETFLQVFEQIAPELQPITSEGPSCDANGVC
ncbi:DsbA family oxidoreductase [Adhaeribacter radiodurans]|uniref:DsbA family oxidoreductase n=1 Tax=Adhaeribacter radiodurans TaxID=2745197 RepID=A0A7L7L4P3_9BACT|nr:DsbA family oxidoreductase [Adhaeribacter radiodurans]QMU27766.1 DsbA family oxidoreductase [Adhaeribacter radiodurans]